MCFKERNPQVNSEKLGGEKVADTFVFPEKIQNQKKKKTTVKQFFCTFSLKNCKCNSSKLKVINQ